MTVTLEGIFTRSAYFTLNPGCIAYREDQCTLYSAGNQSKLLANNIFILKHAKIHSYLYAYYVKNKYFLSHQIKLHKLLFS